MSDTGSLSVGKLATALAKAQGEFPVIPKDSEVEVKNKEGKFLYKYKYADLTTIISCTRPALSKNGLSFTQGMATAGFVTTLLHESGEVLQCGFIPCEVPRSADMKAVAGLITYVKRISLTAALGVSADEDIDAAANEATAGNSTQKSPTTKSAAPPAEKKLAAAGIFAPASDADIEMLYGLCQDRNIRETFLNELISTGYGEKSRYPKIWIVKEVAKLLENEDTTEETLKAETQRVYSRREAARLKAEKEKGGAK